MVSGGCILQQDLLASSCWPETSLGWNNFPLKPSGHLGQQQSPLLHKPRRATAHQRGSGLGEMLKILAGMSSPSGKWLGWKSHTAHGLTVVKDWKGFKRQSRDLVSLCSVLFLCFATALWVQVGENLSIHIIQHRNQSLLKGFAWHQSKFAVAPASVAQKVFSRWTWTGIRSCSNICIPFLCVMWRCILWSPNSSCSYPNCFMSKLKKHLKASSCSNFWRRKPN